MKLDDLLEYFENRSYTVEIYRWFPPRINVGLFKIVGGPSVASGVRRIEALAGTETFQRLEEDEGLLKSLSHNSPATIGNISNCDPHPGPATSD